MKGAVIIGNGQFPHKAYPRYIVETADIVICCDRGAQKYLQHYARRPDAIVGDMDSLPAGLRRRFADIVVRCPGQDDNDQTKALRHLLGRWPDVTDIHFIGATGLREDHTIGNIGLLMEYPRLFDLGGRRLDMVSDHGTLFAVTDTVILDVGEGRTVSLFSPDSTLTIRSEGLQYPTDGVVFDNWWQATLNRAVSDRVTLTFSHPSRAIVFLD